MRVITIKVVVGSQNPVKINGVKRAFSYYYSNVEVLAVKPVSNVPPQPITLEETVLGAVSRGYNALLEVENADYGVGIEAGFIRFPSTITGFLDVQIAAIVDREGYVTIGTSQAFEFPSEAVSEVIRGDVIESEEVISRITGIIEIGDKMGAIGYLTKGKILREDLTVQAVISALIPRLNRRLYINSWPKAKDVINKLLLLVEERSKPQS